MTLYLLDLNYPGDTTLHEWIMANFSEALEQDRLIYLVPSTPVRHWHCPSLKNAVHFRAANDAGEAAVLVNLDNDRLPGTGIVAHLDRAFSGATGQFAHVPSHNKPPLTEGA